MGEIIAAVVLIVAAIGFSAWWKGRLIGQGKIIQRASDFVEYEVKPGSVFCAKCGAELKKN